MLTSFPFILHCDLHIKPSKDGLGCPESKRYFIKWIGFQFRVSYLRIAFYFCFHLQFCLWGYTVPTGTFLFCFVLVSWSGLPNNLEGSGQFKMNVNIFWQTSFILFLLQSYFKDNWNTFDFVTVVGSIVDALMVEFAVSINICVANIRKGFESFSTVSSLAFFRLLYALKIAQAHAGYIEYLNQNTHFHIPKGCDYRGEFLSGAL